ncbi:MAG: MATE family efflux transporter [Muribaculum sp.]|nr:MATE family efflux transporter [Muribaculum sp.]
MNSGSQSERLQALATRPVGRLLWEYSLPAVAGIVVMSLYNVMDRIFIGRGVGPEAIAGLALTFPVMNLSAAIGILVGTGAAARVSILLGMNDRHGAQRVLGISTVLTVINALIYISLFAIFIDPILRSFGASDATLPYARDFMLYILPGMLIMNVMFSLNNVMRASGYPRLAMWTQMIGAGVNLVLGPLFIFGLDMGIKGAAIATDLSMTVGMVWVLMHFSRPSSTVHFQRGIYRLDWRVIWGIITIGAAPSLVNFAASAINVIVIKALGHYGGDLAVGAVGIFSSYTGLLCMTVVGICQGAQPIIGYNYGAGNNDRLKRCFWLAAAVSVAITSIGAIPSNFFPEVIAKAFTVDPQLIDVTARALKTATWSFWIVGFPIIATVLFQATGMAGKSIFIGLIRQVIYLVPLLFILPRYFMLDGVWLSFPLADIGAFVTTLAMVWYQFRVFRRQS